VQNKQFSLYSNPQSKMTFKAKLFTFHVTLFLQSEAESGLNLRTSSRAERLKHPIYFELETKITSKEISLHTKVSSRADFYKMTG